MALFLFLFTLKLLGFLLNFDGFRVLQVVLSSQRSLLTRTRKINFFDVLAYIDGFLHKFPDICLSLFLASSSSSSFTFSLSLFHFRCLGLLKDSTFLLSCFWVLSEVKGNGRWWWWRWRSRAAAKT